MYIYIYICAIQSPLFCHLLLLASWSMVAHALSTLPLSVSCLGKTLYTYIYIYICLRSREAAILGFETTLTLT